VKRSWPAIRWTLDKLLRLAAAVTALVTIPIALFGGLAIVRDASTSGFITGLSTILFAVLIAFFVLITSVVFWPNQSKKLKRPALIVLTIIYVSGTCGISLAGAGFAGVSYAKTHGLLPPTRVDPEFFHRHS
jgi:hypothetical protein